MIQVTEILNKEELTRILKRLAYEVLEDSLEIDDLVVIGIKTRGACLAPRLVRNIYTITRKNIPVGAMDITLYRDDLTEIAEQPLIKSTDIPFSIYGKRIILIDDVIYTGRTVRAALDALLDLGRPTAIQLMVLIDRGHRELPIHADFIGRCVKTRKEERIHVNLEEVDCVENVVIAK